MRILIACEFSGIVRDAFIRKGHDAVSCDLLPTEIPGPHIQDDVLMHLHGWDLMVAFPPCTHLCSSGARWFPEKQEEQAEALRFVNLLLNAPVGKIALENPVGVISTVIRAPHQKIQPYEFGENASKKTCLWLKGLPLLIPTRYVEADCYGCSCGQRFELGLGKYGCPNCNGAGKARQIWGNQTPTGQNKLGPSDKRALDRSRTYTGIAAAMAEQWG